MEKPILIAYFSRLGQNYVNGNIIHLQVGNTEVAALKIQKITGGELFKIDPVQKYSDDYNTCAKEAQREYRTNARVKLVDIPESIDGVETMILAYPNWCGTMPMAVWTFLEQHDFIGKTILPLCTHEGSGMGQSEADIRELCPGAIVKKGLAIKGGSVENADIVISEWLNKSL